MYLNIEALATAIAVLSARRARQTAQGGSEKRQLGNTEESLFKKPRVENDSEDGHSTPFAMKLRSSSSSLIIILENKICVKFLIKILI